jgi:hypothetical protein
LRGNGAGSFDVVAATLAYLPFRVVYVPTTWVGRLVAWFAAGYREASAIERAFIFPSWAILRGVFLLGCGLARVLHAAGTRALPQ